MGISCAVVAVVINTDGIYFVNSDAFEALLFRGKSPQSLSPGSFAMDVAKASRRICAQARWAVRTIPFLLSYPFLPYYFPNSD